MDVRIFVIILIFQTVDPGTWYPEYSWGGGNLTYLNGVSDVFTAQLGKNFTFHSQSGPSLSLDYYSANVQNSL